MGNIAKKLFRIAAIGGSMFLADGIIAVFCPQLKGVSKGLACLASVTICGALADQGATYATRVLEGSVDSVRKGTI